jgi:hypothetical protein
MGHQQESLASALYHCFWDVYTTSKNTSFTYVGLVYFSGILIPERCGDMWRFDVHPILSNSLKYSSPKILYYDREFFI